MIGGTASKPRLGNTPRVKAKVALKSLDAFPANYDEAMRKFAKALQCQICQQQLDNPQLLECEHAFCSRCIQQVVQRTNKCPTCYSHVYPCEVKRDHMLNSLLQKFSEMKAYYDRINVILEERKAATEVDTNIYPAPVIPSKAALVTAKEPCQQNVVQAVQTTGSHALVVRSKNGSSITSSKEEGDNEDKGDTRLSLTDTLAKENIPTTQQLDSWGKSISEKLRQVKQLSIATSGLWPHEINQVERSCRTYGWKYVQEVSLYEKPTYLIVGVHEKNGNPYIKTTSKYLTAVALGVKTVRIEWLYACEGNPSAAVDRDYKIVKSDTAEGNRKDLFNDFEIILAIDGSSVHALKLLSVSTARTILEGVGASFRDITAYIRDCQVHTDLPKSQLSKAPDGKRRIVLSQHSEEMKPSCPDDSCKSCAFNKRLGERFEAPVVDSIWLAHCVLKNKTLGLTQFLL